LQVAEAVFICRRFRPLQVFYFIDAIVNDADFVLGSPLWNFTYVDGASHITSPVVGPAQDSVLFATSNGDVFAFDVRYAPAPSLSWNISLPAGVCTTPVFSRDGTNVYLFTDDGDALAVDASLTSGFIMWEKKKLLFSAPVAGIAATVNEQGQIFVVDDNGTLYSLDASGNLTWFQKVASCVEMTPVCSGNVVMVGTCNEGSVPNFIAALDANTGKSLWNLTSRYTRSSPVVVEGPDGGMIAYAADGYQFFSFNVTNGKMLAKMPFPKDFQTSDLGQGNLAVGVDGSVFVSTFTSIVQIVQGAAK
jgi:outer membrane protein assembly factor BamB